MSLAASEYLLDKDFLIMRFLRQYLAFSVLYPSYRAFTIEISRFFVRYHIYN